MRAPEPVASGAATPRSDAAGVAMVVAAVAVLSLNSSMIKGAHAPGPVAGFWRLTVAALLWHAILTVRRRSLSRSDWRAVLVPGLCFGVNITLFFTGVTRTRVANAEFIGTLSPLFVVPFAAFRLGERVRRRTILLGATALCGVALVVLFSGKGGSHSWVGDGLILASMVSWTAYLLLGRRVRQGVDTAAFMAGVSTVAALTLLPTAAATGRLFDLPLRSYLLLALMGLTAGVVGHGMLAWAQRHAPMSTISLLQLAQPAAGATWAYLLLGEEVRPIQVVGMALMLVSVAGIVRGAVKAATAAGRRRSVRAARVKMESAT